jgi:hypothetical protein
MARPASVFDIEVADVHTATLLPSQLTLHPEMMAAYAEFIRACVAAGATVTEEYSTIKVERKATKKEIEDQLALKQKQWDGYQTNYNEIAEGTEIAEYKVSGTKTWAEAEGMPWPPVRTDTPVADASV